MDLYGTRTIEQVTQVEHRYRIGNISISYQSNACSRVRVGIGSGETE